MLLMFNTRRLHCIRNGQTEWEVVDSFLMLQIDVWWWSTFGRHLCAFGAQLWINSCAVQVIQADIVSWCCTFEAAPWFWSDLSSSIQSMKDESGSQVLHCPGQPMLMQQKGLNQVRDWLCMQRSCIYWEDSSTRRHRWMPDVLGLMSDLHEWIIHGHFAQSGPTNDNLLVQSFHAVNTSIEYHSCIYMDWNKPN